MKKKLAVYLLACSMATLATGCNNLSGGSTPKVNRVVTSYVAASADEAEKYTVADCFQAKDGKYYYLYNVGYIEAVPVAIDNSSGLYYSGENTTLTFTMKKSTEETITNTVKNIASKTVTLSTSTTVSAEVGVSYAKVGAAVETECINSFTDTFETTVSNARTEMEEFSQTVEYKFDKNTNAVGYYCYTSLASVQLFEVVVYNPNTQTVESAVPYSILGKSFPGLIYSKTSFFDCNPNDIEFDISKITEFAPPNKILDGQATLTFDCAGGSCNPTSKVCDVGEAVGSLPTPSGKHGFEFEHWTLNGMKFDENSIAVKDSTVVAVWKPITKATYNAPRISSQNSFGTGEGLETATIEFTLSTYFNIPYLKNEGYAIRLTFNYDVDYLTTSVGSLNYKFYVTNGRTTIFSYDDSISGKRTRQLSSGKIFDYEGTIFIKLHTQNIQGVEIYNHTITVEFVK